MKRVLLTILAFPVFALAIAWGAAAIAIDGPASPGLSRGLAAVFGLASIACLLALRPFSRGLIAFCVLLLGVLAWWLSLAPSQDREWLPDVANPASAVFEGDRVTVRNVRNFHYRSETDYDERWEERSYDLSKLRGLDMFFSHWGSPHIAHTIASWDFEGSEPLAISIETRKEQGEEYSAVLGFFRQFELYYVVADERDLVKLRTHHRDEDVYLYRLRMPTDQARELLVDYLEEVNRLSREPKWYNALTHNCTTTIRLHMQQVGIRNPFQWQLIVNGHLPELGHRRGQVNNDLPFAELKQRSFVSPVALALGPDESYSQGIRRGLPPR
jgi:hypothetical protein